MKFYKQYDDIDDQVEGGQSRWVSGWGSCRNGCTEDEYRAYLETQIWIKEVAVQFLTDEEIYAAAEEFAANNGEDELYSTPLYNEDLVWDEVIEMTRESGADQKNWFELSCSGDNECTEDELALAEINAQVYEAHISHSCISENYEYLCRNWMNETMS